MEDLDVTPHTAAVLKAFLEDPARPRYGFELMQLTRLGSGTLYQVLARLEAAGWLATGREGIDPPSAGRPARMNYTLTEDGISGGRIQLAQLSEQDRRLSAPARLMPGTALTGTGYLEAAAQVHAR